MRLNGERVSGVEPGQYLRLEREWVEGDTVQIDLDMSLHFWVGEQECDGLTSVYRGPLLLAFDHRYNLDLAKPGIAIRDYDEWKSRIDYGLNVPALDARRMRPRLVGWYDWFPPVLLVECEAASGEVVRLCDYGSAGEVGTPYMSWLPVGNAPRGAFSRQNPLPSAHG